MWSVFSHEYGANKWKIASPPEVNEVQFSASELCMNQDKPQYALREWRRGGRMIEWMKQQRVRAVEVPGYNVLDEILPAQRAASEAAVKLLHHPDPGRIRVVRWCRRQRFPIFLFGDSNIRGDLSTGARAVAKRTLVRRGAG